MLSLTYVFFQDVSVVLVRLLIHFLGHARDVITVRVMSQLIELSLKPTVIQ